MLLKLIDHVCFMYQIIKKKEKKKNSYSAWIFMNYL